MRSKDIGVVLVPLLLVIVVVLSQNVPAMKEMVESQTLRQSCHTLVISASVVIVNCSHSDIGQPDGLDVSNIDHRVTSLDLSWTKLTMIPGLINNQEKNLANLVYLNLSNNQISQHYGFKNVKLDSVRHLDLSSNQLTQFPFCAPGLLTINLESNKITVVDVSRDVGACGKLRQLSLAGNLINNFSSSCGLSDMNGLSLETLDLSSNRIKQLNNCAFDLFDRLLHLNISHNGMKNVPDGIFKNLGMLEKLDLSHNSIEYFAPGSIEIIKDLKFLDVSHNKVKTLPNALPMTDWFDASFNMITTMPETFSSVLYPQSVFLLGGNPFVCNCDLLWLKEFFDTRKYLLKFLKTVNKTKFIPVCSGPDNLKGASWDSLDDSAFECSGLEDKETNLIKKNVEQVLAGKDLIEAAEIGETFVMLQWSVPPDLSISVELSYHKFGQKKDRKEIVLPSSVTSYRLKKLEAGAPYVICLKVTLSNELNDCIEVVTRVREDTGWNSQIVIALQSILSICCSRFDIVILSVGLVTVIYFLFLREENGSKSK